MTESPFTKSNKVGDDGSPEITEVGIHICFVLGMACGQFPAVP